MLTFVQVIECSGIRVNNVSSPIINHMYNVFVRKDLKCWERHSECERHRTVATSQEQRNTFYWVSVFIGPLSKRARTERIRFTCFTVFCFVLSTGTRNRYMACVCAFLTCYVLQWYPLLAFRLLSASNYWIEACIEISTTKHNKCQNRSLKHSQRSPYFSLTHKQTCSLSKMMPHTHKTHIKHSKIYADNRYLNEAAGAERWVPLLSLSQYWCCWCWVLNSSVLWIWLRNKIQNCTLLWVFANCEQTFLSKYFEHDIYIVSSAVKSVWKFMHLCLCVCVCTEAKARVKLTGKTFHSRTIEIIRMKQIVAWKATNFRAKRVKK